MGPGITPSSSSQPEFKIPAKHPRGRYSSQRLLCVAEYPECHHLIGSLHTRVLQKCLPVNNSPVAGMEALAVHASASWKLAKIYAPQRHSESRPSRRSDLMRGSLILFRYYSVVRHCRKKRFLQGLRSTTLSLPRIRCHYTLLQSIALAPRVNYRSAWQSTGRSLQRYIRR